MGLIISQSIIDIKRGDVVDVEIEKKHFKLTIQSNIPFGHKFATKKIQKSEKVIKYGEVIGEATHDIYAYFKVVFECYIKLIYNEIISKYEFFYG